MPWQRLVLDVALEVDEATGRLVYGEVDLTVPRQSGKSTLVLAKSVHRCTATGFFGPRQRVVYTAQTRIKAREKWEEDYAADLEHSRTFKRMVRVHKSNGNEHIRFQNGSRFGIDANTESAGHGGTLDEAYIDEAFAQRDGRLEQAFRPAMITRPSTQLWVVSTAGWLGESPFLEPKIASGRARLATGEPSRVAYFEWSAPEDSDPLDEDVWRATMPALGHTIDIDDIRGELESLGVADFQRAYLNMWVPKPSLATESLVPEQSWARCGDHDSALVGPMAFGLDVSPDGSASIGVAGNRADGLPHVAVVESRPGTDWVAGRLAELQRRWHPRVIVVDSGGPAGALVPDLRAAGVEFHEVTVRELVQGCGRFLNLVKEAGLRHRDEGALNAAVKAARKRTVGDAWAWARRNVETDMSPLYAVTFSLIGLAAEVDVTDVVFHLGSIGNCTDLDCVCTVDLPEDSAECLDCGHLHGDPDEED